jgi:hypothetical protein
MPQYLPAVMVQPVTTVIDLYLLYCTGGTTEPVFEESALQRLLAESSPLSQTLDSPLTSNSRCWYLMVTRDLCNDGNEGSIAYSNRETSHCTYLCLN